MESLKKGPSTAHSLSVEPGEETLSVIVVGLSEQETRVLRELAREAGWKLQREATCREAMARLCLERTPVIVCGSSLPDGSWEDVLSGTAAQNNRPRLIVVSRYADERLWLDVLSLGGFDVISSPFREVEMRRSIESAWRNWGDEVQQEIWRRTKHAAAG